VTGGDGDDVLYAKAPDGQIDTLNQDDQRLGEEDEKAEDVRVEQKQRRGGVRGGAPARWLVQETHEGEKRDPREHAREDVHPRFLGEVHGRRRERRESGDEESGAAIGEARADEVRDRNGECADQHRKTPHGDLGVAERSHPVVQQDVVERRVRVAEGGGASDRDGIESRDPDGDASSYQMLSLPSWLKPSARAMPTSAPSTIGTGPRARATVLISRNRSGRPRSTRSATDGA
jgi:hypothetical protein